MTARRLPPYTRLRALLLAALAVACGTSPPAQEGALRAHLIVGDTDEVFARWRAAAPAIDASIENLRHATADRPFSVGCVVSGFATDERGVVNLRVDLDLIDPQGKVALHQDNFAVYERKPDPGRHAVLAAGTYETTIESSDAPGTYELRATVTDLVGGGTAVARHALELSPARE
jgi:hypothetical protein